MVRDSVEELANKIYKGVYYYQTPYWQVLERIKNCVKKNFSKDPNFETILTVATLADWSEEAVQWPDILEDVCNTTELEALLVIERLITQSKDEWIKNIDKNEIASKALCCVFQVKSCIAHTSDDHREAFEFYELMSKMTTNLK